MKLPESIIPAVPHFAYGALHRQIHFSICLLALSTIAVAADPVNEMPTFQHDEMAAKLIAQGYRDLRLVGPDNGHVSAYDQNGSEVLIVVEVANRRVIEVNYVHASDQ